MSYQKLLRLLFAAALPLLLVSTNLRYAVNELRLYQYGFDKYNVAATTGLDKAELTKAAQSLIDYFNSPYEPINTKVVKGGQTITLYNEREASHLKDVKELILMMGRLQSVTLFYILVYIVVGFAVWRRAMWRNLAAVVIGGSVFTVMILALFSISALFNFDSIFLQFHLLSFANDLWMLDPSRDRLIRMFPQGFFQDAAMFIALATIVEALVLGGIAGAALMLRQRKTPTGITVGVTENKPELDRISGR